MASGSIIGKLLNSAERTAMRSAFNSAAHQQPRVSAFRAGLQAMPQTPSATRPTRLSAVAARNFQAQRELGGYSSRKTPGTIDIEALQSTVSELNTAIKDKRTQCMATRLAYVYKDQDIKDKVLPNTAGNLAERKRLEQELTDNLDELEALKQEHEDLVNKAAIVVSEELKATPSLRHVSQKFEVLQAELSTLKDLDKKEFADIKLKEQAYDKLCDAQKKKKATQAQVDAAYEIYVEARGPVSATGPYDERIEEIKAEMDKLTAQMAAKNPRIAAALKVTAISENENESESESENETETPEARRSEIAQSLTELVDTFTHDTDPVSQKNKEIAVQQFTQSLMKAIMKSADIAGKIRFDAAPKADNTRENKAAQRKLIMATFPPKR